MAADHIAARVRVCVGQWITVEQIVWTDLVVDAFSVEESNAVTLQAQRISRRYVRAPMASPPNAA